MEKIRVLIALRSPLARDLVRSIISGQADFEVVGETQDLMAILSTIEQTKADSLIISQEKADQRPAICDWVFQVLPRTRILAITSSGEGSTLYWFQTQIRSVIIETWEGVLSALRTRDSED